MTRLRHLGLLCGLLAPLAFASCSSAAPKEISRSEFVLGTACSIRIASGLSSGAGEKLLDKAFARLRELEDELSVNKAGSSIDAVNDAAGSHPVAVGKDAMSILKRDLVLSSWSDGAFDPTVGPLVKLWGIGTDHARLPTAGEIAAAKALVGYRDIVLDEGASTVFLKRPGMGLDLGSTTKGYAADEVAAILRVGGAKGGIIDLGGNVLALGAKSDGSGWRIGLQNPFSEERGAYLGVATLKDETMVTSGVYERFFIKDGVRYHHILDTRTGYPVQNGLVSATVITPRSFDADGLTTTIFALGREKGLALAAAKGVDAILVDADRKVYLSGKVSKYFEITDKSFTYAE
jgi:Membrane-associated lipoprotein involved in thiamine biosynthesis